MITKKNVAPVKNAEYIAVKIKINPIAECGMRFAFPPYNSAVLKSQLLPGRPAVQPVILQRPSLPAALTKPRKTKAVMINRAAIRANGAR